MADVASISLMTELEARQDEVLRQLDELDLRILAVISEFAPKVAAAKAARSEKGVPALRITEHVGPHELAPAVEMPRLADGAEQSQADAQAQKAA